MPTTRRSTSRAAGTARTQILTDLKDDHKRVKKAYREFQKLDAEDDTERCEAIVRQVCAELEVHAALEEELLYPAARGALQDEDLIDEAEVEHESVHTLIAQLKGMCPDDEKFFARFTVLCEYVLHHVKEEEGEMFPQLERARLDWEDLAADMTERREELAPSSDGMGAEDESPEDAAASRQRSADTGAAARRATARRSGSGSAARGSRAARRK